MDSKPYVSRETIVGIVNATTFMIASLVDALDSGRPVSKEGLPVCCALSLTRPRRMPRLIFRTFLALTS